MSMQSDNNGFSQKYMTLGPIALTFDALGKSFDLRLEPNVGFLSTAAVSVIPQGIGIYRGGLAGVADSWARIVVFENVPRGFVWDGSDMFVIEAPGDSIVNTATPVIYRLADTYIEAGTMMCGSESLAGNGAATYGKLVGELSVIEAQAPGAVSQIDLGAVGDFEFTSAQGGDAAAFAAISDRLNRVDGIFSQEIGVQINVPTIQTFSDPADPFTDQSDPAMLLDEVVSYRQNTPAQNSLGLTHMWTGRDLDGTTVGIAYNDVLCRSGYGAGLSEGNGSAAFDSLVAAHEIGHNFGAPHDGVAGACESEPQTFLMAPMINGNDQFSQCSIDIMTTNAAQAACITPLPTVDVAVTLTGQAPSVLLGADTMLTYDVPNYGSLQATNVVADFSIPTNLAIDSVASSIGNCTDGAGTVSCVLGNVPGLSANTVTIAVTPSAVGTGTLTATISADADERLVNNQDSRQLTVDPAVDLVVNSPSALLVNLDQSATFSATPQNNAIIDATGVTLGFSFGSGVRIDSANWSAGSCTVTGQQVDCQVPSFARQSTSTLTIGLTGMTAGEQTYDVTILSNEVDANPMNNSVSGTVTVDDATAGESGGGSVGAPFLWFLGIMVFITRRRPASVAR